MLRGVVAASDEHVREVKSGRLAMVKVPAHGLFAPPSPFFKNICARETEILEEQQPPQVVFVCDHAGLVINKFSRPATPLDRSTRGNTYVVSSQVTASHPGGDPGANGCFC